MLWKARFGLVCGRGAVDGADIIPPTITSGNTDSVSENAALSHALTADEAVTWSIVGGADQARFEISGSTLRWLANISKNYEVPDDADTNNTYVVTVRATDLASNTTDQTITITVTDDPTEGGSTFDKTTVTFDSTTHTMDAV